jgi:DNA helicase-2/ATP-dependent DNA helicase PcrA
MSYSDKNVDLLDLLKSKLQPFVTKEQIEILRAAASKRSVFDLLSEQETKKEKQKSYLSLKEQFQRLNKLPPQKAIQTIRKEMGYDKTVENICDSLGFSQEYIQTVLNILEAIAGNESTHPGFANRLNCLKERIDTSYQNKGKDVVTLSTIHSAKGLEWENVFVVDLVQGILPHYNAVKQADRKIFEDLEEERRLFYVAMTRAQKQLTLYTSKTYHNSPVNISQFVKEVQLLSEGKDPKDASKNRILGELGEGLVVIHQSFGEGVIIDISENIITVLFKDGSKKQLIKDLCEKKQLLRAK